jgi:hypothetical protein
MRIEELSQLPVISAAPGTPVTLTIAAGQSLSNAVDLKDQRVNQIIIPAGFENAAITFRASPDGVTYYDLFDTNGEVNIPSAVVAAGRAIVVDPGSFFGAQFIQVRSGTSAAAVAQTQARSITVVTVPR